MIVPRHWAEATERATTPTGRKVTVRRFGWSNVSIDDAQRMASARASEALARVLDGSEQRRFDRKVVYGGVEGLPIREEVVEQHDDVVITRNAYGARCLNTPNVLFADIDFDREASLVGGCLVMVVLIALEIIVASRRLHGVGQVLRSLLVLIPFSAITTAGVVVAHQRWARVWAKFRSRGAIFDFVALHPHWSIRRYRTPRGLRLLVMHATFDPQSEEVRQFFEALDVDRVYARMCRLQGCFRARVSPKPWRAGIEQHMAPSGGRWPVLEADILERRHRWVESYEAATIGYASCHYEETLGSGAPHPRAEHVRSLHDAMSRAGERLPLA